MGRAHSPERIAAAAPPASRTSAGCHKRVSGVADEAERKQSMRCFFRSSLGVGTLAELKAQSFGRRL